MGFALGVLHWTPDTFWRATWPEVIAAIDGYMQANGISEQDEPLTHAEANELLAEANRRNARRKNGNGR